MVCFGDYKQLAMCITPSSDDIFTYIIYTGQIFGSHAVTILYLSLGYIGLHYNGVAVYQH